MKSRAVLVVVVAVAAVLFSPGTASARSGPPVLDANFPDPDVVRVGDVYHAYASNGRGQNIQHATSTDLEGWSLDGGSVLPEIGAWARLKPFPAGGPEDDSVWAPEVFRADDGFVMWYTANDRASDVQCIGAAASPSPEGPFTPEPAPLICPSGDGGAIDASSFVEDGQRYILWKNDGNCCGLDTWLHLQPVSGDGLRTTGPATRLIKQDRDFEGALVEAPTLWKHDGTYVLLYSANSFADCSYTSSYATAASLSGPYTKAPAPLLSTGSFSGTVCGPGGQDVVVGPDGRDRMLFHGWDGARTERSLYLADLGWANGLPVVRGSIVRQEAEDGGVVDAAVRSAGGASGGRAVGGIDGPDSRVELDFYAPRSGEYTLFVTFGNGSVVDGAPVDASHTLTIDGAPAGDVGYPHTGWDRWTTTERTITLTEGFHSLSLGKGANWAELDVVGVG